ncbi:AI-2E family transporter [Nocardioides sp.]|uniref:AI-2E family transporter n=1 Tax=Nocardioides sp. TaxID=35761 RepID=UPI00378350D6
MSTMIEPAPRSGLPRALLLLLGMAAAVIVVAGMKAVSGLLAPLFLALILTVLAHPIRRWLDHWMPSWAASAICIVVVYVGIVLLALAMLVSIARFAELLPTYADKFGEQLSNLTAWLDKMGVSQSDIKKAESSFDLGSLGGFLTGLLGQLLGMVSNLFFIFALILFMTFDASSFPRQLERARAARPLMVGSLEDFAHQTRRYLGVSTVFGLIVAVLDTIALAMLGVPLPMTWGLLAFITNYIPNIGFVIGLIPPAILALLEGGPGLMLAVIAVYCVLNVIIQSVIQPKVVGDTVGLSTTLSFFSLVFWTWVVGPLGAILAIPLTLFGKALLVDSDPTARWLRPLISNRDEQPPPDEADDETEADDDTDGTDTAGDRPGAPAAAPEVSPGS